MAISAPLSLTRMSEFLSLMNPLLTQMLGESASVEIQARTEALVPSTKREPRGGIYVERGVQIVVSGEPPIKIQFYISREISSPNYMVPHSWINCCSQGYPREACDAHCLSYPELYYLCILR